MKPETFPESNRRPAEATATPPISELRNAPCSARPASQTTDDATPAGGANDDLSFTIATVLHELSSPLTHILGTSQLALRRAEALDIEPELRALLGQIRDSAESVQHVFRALTRQAAAVPESRCPLSVSRLIERARTICEHVFEEHRVWVEERLTKEELLVFGHEHELVQVLVNLFKNAAQAMAPKGGGRLRITVHAAPTEQMVEVSIEDEGVGIAPADQPRIFEPFFTNKSHGHPMGLGLSISAKLIASHGGSLEARSVFGQSSCFTLRLPRTTLEPR